MAMRRVITRGGSYDSELGRPRSSDNRSMLTLVVKIHLYQINPSRGRQTGTMRDGSDRFTIEKWNASEWRNYQDRFDDLCEMVWNGELYLLPPSNLPAGIRTELSATSRGAAAQTPYIECNLDVQVVSQRGGSHATLGVYRLADTETKTYRSYITQQAGRDTGRMSNHDIYMEMHWDGDNLRQFSTVAHEVGHVLGLNHPICSGNANRCYGAQGTPAHNSTMGFGSNMMTGFATPWTRRIGQHTGHRRGWTATMTRPNQPTLLELMRASIASP